MFYFVSFWNLLRTALLLGLLLLMSACASTSTPQGDPRTGEQIFEQTLQMTGVASCQTCHTTQAHGESLLGPSLAGIATTAATRTNGMSPEEYLRQSIISPNDYIVAGYAPGLMPRTYGEVLTTEQINHLIAYLMSLE